MSALTESNAARLLERSLRDHRLAHAYLFSGDAIEQLEAMARQLAQALNCRDAVAPTRSCLVPCGHCDACQRIAHDNHPDVLWVRPESKMRLILIEQMRDLMQTMNLKPSSAEYKVGVIVAADRMTAQAANAFLKTLEEPPPKSILLLLTTEPQRVLETILSRCLRLNFGGDASAARALPPAWLAPFSQMAARPDSGLLGRYKLLGLVMGKLNTDKEEIEKTLAERSPLARYAGDDVEKQTREKWEEELAAAVEAEYRRRRGEVIGALQLWLRDIWLHTLRATDSLLSFPDLAAAAQPIAARLSPADALGNLEQIERLHRQLQTNAQEALAMEVSFLKLKL